MLNQGYHIHQISSILWPLLPAALSNTINNLNYADRFPLSYQFSTYKNDAESDSAFFNAEIKQCGRQTAPQNGQRKMARQYDDIWCDRPVDI